MAYFSVKMGGGLSLKADSTSIPDNACTVCYYAGFDTVGAITSGKGRAALNNGFAINGTNSILGGFDGLASSASKKFRFFKSNSAVYTNTVTGLDESTNQNATYTTSVGTLKNRVYGLTAPTWGATGNLSGFTYSGYAYLADGSTTQRLKLTDATPPTAPTVDTETWGLQSPGYHELTAAAPLSAETGTSATTVKVTVPDGHGLGLGVQVSPSYPIAMNMELVGFQPIGGAPDNQINGLHSGYAGTGASDITVTSSGGTLSSGATYTFTFGGQYEYQAITQMQTKDGASFPNLTTAYTPFVVTESGSSTANAIQTLTGNTDNSAGQYWRIKFFAPNGDKEVSEPIPYDATAAQVQAAMQNMLLFGDGSAAPITSTTSITSATEFTFAVTTAMTGGSISGGGSIGFIRQGPTLTASANAGELVSGTYYYAYTFYNGVAESNFSAQVPIDVSTSDAVVLTNVLLGPAGTTERRIYRTDVNGRQLYYIGKITNNTAGESAAYTYTDTARKAAGADYDALPGDTVVDAENPPADSDKQSRKRQASKRGILEAQAKSKAADEKKRERLATNLGLLSDWTDHDPPPSGLKHVGLLGETAFGITGSELAFSQSGNVEHWPLSNRVKPGRNTSETLQAWVPFDRDCIMYTSNGLYRLSQVGLSFDDSRFEEIESPVGLAGEWAVAALDGQQGHIFLAKSGLYMFDGARVNEISFPIEPMFTDPYHADYINPLYMSSAVMVTSRDRMMLFYATTSGGNNRMLWGDFQDPASPNFSVYEWSHTSVWREKSSNYIVAGDSSGKVYVLDTDWAVPNGAIDWEITTKEYPLNEGKPFMLDEVVLDADFAGVSTTLTVATRARGVAKSCTFTNTTNGRQRVKLKVPSYMKGEVCSLSVSSSTDTKQSLYSVGWTFLPMGEP